MPFTIIAEIGKLPEYSLKGSSPINANEPRHVLQTDIVRSHVANDPPTVGPEVALVSLASPLSGDRPRLTGKTGCEEIHSAAPGLAVKIGKVIPEEGVVKVSGSHPLDEEPLTPRVFFNIPDGAEPRPGQSEAEASHAAAQVEVRGT